MSVLRKIWFTLGVFVLPCVLSPAWAQESCETVVAVVAGAQPPYVWQSEANEEAQGAYLDFAKALGEGLGIEVQVLVEPNKVAAREEVAAGRADLLLADVVAREGLEQFDYLYPALYERELIAWVPEAQQFSYQGWNDLRGKRAVLVTEQMLPAQFGQFAQANLSLVTAETFDQALQMLHQGKADFLIYGRVAGEAAFAQRDEALRLRALAWPLFDESLHVAVSHRSACNVAKLRGQLAVQLHQAAEQGKFYPVQQRALQAWLAELAPVVDADVQE